MNEAQRYERTARIWSYVAFLFSGIALGAVAVTTFFVVTGCRP